MKSKYIDELDREFLYDVQEAMEIRKSDVVGDYTQLVGRSDFKNGLMGAVWDNRYAKILTVAKKHQLAIFPIDLKIWKAVALLDKKQELLYLFTSSKNYNDVVRKILAGNRTHYFYLLTVNSEPSQFEQLKLFEDDEMYQKRLNRAKNILKNDLDKAKNIAVINYDYYGNSSIGKISFLDNTAQEIDSISLDEYFKLTARQVLAETHNQNKLNDATIQAKAIVTWNPKRRNENAQESGDD